MLSEEKISKYLIENNLTISTAESCTGGLLSSKLTDVSGSSCYTRLNLVTYALAEKKRMLGVTVNEEEVVSEECAFQMAKGLHKLTNSDICISTTGIAGPTGGSKEKPVGLMYSTIFTSAKSKTYKILLNSKLPRKEMKEKFVQDVLQNLIEFLAI